MILAHLECMGFTGLRENAAYEAQVQPMKTLAKNTNNRSLVRKLAWVVVLKLILITAIWWMFMRDQRVKVEPETAAEHLLAPVSHSVSKE